MQPKKNKRLSHILLRIRKRYRFGNIPILSKLFIAFGLVFISMISLSLIMFVKYKEDKEISTISVIQQMNIQTIGKIDDYINDIKNATKMPLFKESLENDFIYELSQFNRKNTRSLIFQNLSEQIFHRIFNFNDSVHSVFLFNLKGLSVYKMLGSSLSSEYNPKDEEWFKQSIDNFGRPVVIGTFKIPNAVDYSNKPVFVFSVSRGIVDVNSSNFAGIILLNNKIDVLSNLCKKMIMVPEQRVFIIDSLGKVIYDTVESNITHPIDSRLLDEIEDITNGSKEMNYNGTKILADFRTSDITGWKIVNLIPLSALNENIDQMRNTTVIITGILILVLSIFLFLVSSRIVKPIKKLVLLMKLIENGDFDVKLKFNTRDEVGQLAKTFNRMTHKVKKLINEVYVDKIKQKELEVQMLQNQINPHFLYNSLESIHMMAEINHDKETSKMVRDLGKILRYGISKQNETVTVREELNHLDDYINLQKVRFEDLFTITVNVDEALYEFPIIKLLLQPLIENAIYHGLDSREEGGRIEILGYKTEDLIIFEVADNGTGMEAGQVRKLNDYLNDLKNSFKSIGLKNVHKRIKLRYGNEYGIEVFSKPEEGTKVRVTLPGLQAKKISP